MSGWVCQWKPFWIPVGDSFQKAYLEEWIYVGDDSSDEQGLANSHTLVQGAGYKDYTSKQKLPEGAPSAPRSAGHPSGKELRHHCLLDDPGATSSTHSSSVLFLNAWGCKDRP